MSKATDLSIKTALAAAILCLGGPALAYLRAVEPFSGFIVMALALPVAGVGIALAAVGFARSDDDEQRLLAAGSAVVSTFVLVAILAPALAARGLPRINDISTDLDLPPQFVHAAALPANRGRDMSYPGERFAAQQLEAYPELGPLVLAMSPPRAFQRVYEVLSVLPTLEITDTDPDHGRIEAVATSRLFHFVDDVVVRVEPTVGGARVDLRSRSRDGRGDFGVNARRIETILAALR